MCQTTKTERGTIKTCKRCGGKGFGNWAVAHLGVPGLCMACNGSGQVVAFSMATRVAQYLSRMQAWADKLETNANKLETALQNKRFGSDFHQQQVASFRAKRVEVLADIARVAAAGKVSAKEQAASGPA